MSLYNITSDDPLSGWRHAQRGPWMSVGWGGGNDTLPLGAARPRPAISSAQKTERLEGRTAAQRSSRRHRGKN